jgi:hypothetical protein
MYLVRSLRCTTMSVNQKVWSILSTWWKSTLCTVIIHIIFCYNDNKYIKTNNIEYFIYSVAVFVIWYMVYTQVAYSFLRRFQFYVKSHAALNYCGRYLSLVHIKKNISWRTHCTCNGTTRSVKANCVENLIFSWLLRI